MTFRRLTALRPIPRAVPASRPMPSFQAVPAHRLVPASESLHTLQHIDLTSFSESSQDSARLSDSEDPFDPLDLVGLPCCMQEVPIAQSSPKRPDPLAAGDCMQERSPRVPILKPILSPILGMGPATVVQATKNAEPISRRTAPFTVKTEQKQPNAAKTEQKQPNLVKTEQKTQPNLVKTESFSEKTKPITTKIPPSMASPEQLRMGSKSPSNPRRCIQEHALSHTEADFKPFSGPTVLKPYSLGSPERASAYVQERALATSSPTRRQGPVLRPVGLCHPRSPEKALSSHAGASSTHILSPDKSRISPIRTSPDKSRNSPIRMRSPENGPSSPFKKPRFNYPISPQVRSFSPEQMQVRSYFSQEQIRGFGTVAKERPAAKPRFAYPTIQLATQNDGLQDHLADISGHEMEKRVRPLLLSHEQQHVIDMAMRGQSLFFTGSAGTGKSVLLKEMIKALRHKHQAGEVAVTASTGLAGFHIGGMTLHSFAGIGISDSDEATTLKMVRRNRKAVARWKATKVLIVDEISMIDGRLFDKLDYVARAIRRRRDTPFGGIQVVLCGDFYQLPPVSKNDVARDGTESKDSAIFAFESQAWAQAISASITLTEVFRQKGDDRFIDMLNDMRHGVVQPEAEAEFLRLARPLDSSDGIVPTELYATRFEVDKANNSKLAELRGQSMVYTAKDGGSLPDLAREKLLRNFLAPQKLFLKEDAQVMCIKNFDDTLVNGSVGRVIGFYDRDVYHGRRLLDVDPDLSFEDMVKELKKEKVADQLSRKLGKKVAPEDINEKEHGQIIRQSQEELDNVFNFLKQKGPDSSFGSEQDGAESAAEINRRRKIEFIDHLEQSSQGQKHPLVRFKCLDGVTTRDVLVEPERWEITDEATDEVLVFRVQFPLMLAWALSIHKSQGQTLSMVKVDLSRIFENGQAYVALSRAASRDGLQVLNFRKQRVRCHPSVEDFYRSLQTTADMQDEE